MRVKTFASLASAERARAELDAENGFPTLHLPGSYRVLQPGKAYARIRSRGVRTDHAVTVMPNTDGSQFAIPRDLPDSEEIDVEVWRGSGRGTPPARR